MATRSQNVRQSAPRRRRARAAHLEFAAVEIVGALMTPDVVGRVAAFDASDQSETGYGIPLGLKLRDEIARYYRIGEALWNRFSQSSAASPQSSSTFVLSLLRQCFGFDSLQPLPPIHLGERVFPVGYTALGGRVPITIAPAAQESSRRAGVDESLPQFGDGNRRRSATLLIQEYLNAADEARWGLACDGFTLRLLRDSVSMTRPAWIEANLAKIFTEGLFPDFSALWLLIQQSRFGQSGAAVSDCSLERWRESGRIEGVAAREQLRNGVQAALLELGAGFLEHPANNALRTALTSGALTDHAYYEELLRLVYRFIFLFVGEDRDLLHTSQASEQNRKLYREGYSVARLRERSTRRGTRDRHIDAWEGVKATHSALTRGEPKLGLPALGGLFSPGVLPHLQNANLENRRLLEAVWRLAWMRPEGQPLTRVNWRDMETEEFGSVYEGLLEMIPRASAVSKTFTFAEDQEDRGNERKKSGSYYTNDALVKLLLDSTLDPVLDSAEARSPSDPVGEILKLSIIDPACGSGHFLLGAARRAAGRIAKLRSPGAPSQAEFQHALREVVSHCIYGVDKNPMAVELCRVALWIEALEPDKPLAFLDNHVRCGDSLLGVFDYAVLKEGIPDEAYKPLTGDEKAVAKAYSNLNKKARDRKAATGLFEELRAPVELVSGAGAVFAMPEDSLEQVTAKQAAFEKFHSGEGWLKLRAACNTYVAAYFAPKTGSLPSDEDLDQCSVPITDHVWTVVRGSNLSPALTEAVETIAARIGAFHWPIEFPHIFAKGGFDAVVGNPPWERIKLQEQEFFAARSPEIAQAKNKAARNRMIQAIENSEPESPGARLFAEFVFTKRTAEASSEFARNSGRFPLSGTGDVNTYALFAEHFGKLANRNGRSGIIVPTGIATDSSTSAFFGDLISRKRLAGLIDFENRERIFAAVDSRVKFCLLTMAAAELADFSFYLTDPKQLEESERRFSLSAKQIARMNPNTKTAPVFRSRADAALTTKLYSQAPVLIEERSDSEGGDINPWGISFQTLFHMSNDSPLFRSQQELEAEGWSRQGADWVHETGDGRERRVPLYEAKMIHHFDHRWATYSGGAVDDEESARDVTLAEKQNPNYEPTPRYWVPEDEVRIRAARLPASLKRAYRETEANRCLKALVEWLGGYFQLVEGRVARETDVLRILGREQPWRTILGGPIDRFLLTPKTQATGRESQRATPLSADDIAFLQQARKEPIALVTELTERKQPRWLMGWRDICRATDERTVIASVFPKVGTNHKVPLLYSVERPNNCAVFLGLVLSTSFDYVARQKVGGTSLTYSYLKQFVALPPSAFSTANIEFVTPRILELTYTSNSMRPWAEDLGYNGAPFPWDEDRRAYLRAELDAFFAKKYGLSREELRYVLDPSDVKGEDYPSETFRVLKNKEQSQYGEYRTRRLVLEASDCLGNV
jgi:N-6 DNA Methylase